MKLLSSLMMTNLFAYFKLLKIILRAERPEIESSVVNPYLVVPQDVPGNVGHL